MIKVSIITPVFRCSELAYERTLESVNAQTSKDFEWIVVSDGENPDQFFEHWADVRLENNFGPSVARNVGFQISSGKVITYVDMGDELNPERVSNLISLYEKYESDMIFSAYHIVNADGTFAGTFDHFIWIGKENFPTAFEYIKLLDKQNIAIPLGVAHTRKPFVEVGGFQRGIVCGEDGVLWRRMRNVIPNSQILFTSDIAGTYFISETGQSRSQRRFDMGGFAIDGDRKDNGIYLDNKWFKTYSSEEHYDQTVD